jgi:hypothetical protein
MMMVTDRVPMVILSGLPLFQSGDSIYAYLAHTSSSRYTPDAVRRILDGANEASSSHLAIASSNVTRPMKPPPLSVR